ncbi:uncharacterized protein EI90DRAFT_857124 [Cantharellus anzutake]|uniref:uncharacterized protein n=1 Tax=Cantharellus anzutake TaxID=1750568 RepID=UPI00190530A3|nr:uncharacterized protein EI90DRAFT_857124 [Cantharellus anzutake]KAF8332418.1 hypothetical protein EI90DRAFT_857124 [Cantharellus anzutake]
MFFISGVPNFGSQEMVDRIDPALVAEGQNIQPIPTPPPSMFGNTLMLALTCSPTLKEALLRLYEIRSEDLPSLEATISAAFDHWNQERLAATGRMQPPSHILPPELHVPSHAGSPTNRPNFASTSSAPPRPLVPHPHPVNPFTDHRYFDTTSIDASLKRNGHSNGIPIMDSVYPEGPIENPPIGIPHPHVSTPPPVYVRPTKLWDDLIQAREKALAKYFETIPGALSGRSGRS